jgi:hypothetical protein
MCKQWWNAVWWNAARWASPSTTAEDIPAKGVVHVVGHLRVQLQKEQVQGLPAEGGLVLASRTEELSFKESETLQLGDFALSGAVTGAS